MTLREAIAALLEDPLDQILARSILGTTDAGAIADRVSAFVAAQLGRTVVGCPLSIQSVGAVFGVDLDDGSRVVVKAHALGDPQRGFTSHDQIAAAYSAQAELAAAGLPCARVLAPPAAFGDGVAAIMTWLPPGERDDPHAPATRRAMAGFLARTVELGATSRPAIAWCDRSCRLMPCSRRRITRCSTSRRPRARGSMTTLAAPARFSTSPRRSW